MIASVAAFAVAGALTGGAVSAAALGSTITPGTTTISLAQMTASVVYKDTRLFGSPYIIRSGGDTTIDLGEAPAGATTVALGIRCTSPGTVEWGFDGEVDSSASCDPGEPQDSHLTGGFQAFDVGGENTLRVTADRDQTYVLWVSWAAPAPRPEPSASQESAISDGIVTESEYRDGFARYSACMNQAGYPLAAVNETGPIISYANSDAAVMSGEEENCYLAEFKQLDIGWQVQQQEAQG